MKTGIVRLCLAGAVALGLAISGGAIAANDEKGCTIQGTWFGVVDLDTKLLSGWSVTATGKSNSHGVNVLEFPTFDYTLGGAFPEAVKAWANRGVWRRVDGNTFDYSFMSIAVDAGNMPVWMARVSGTSTLSDDCMTEEISATMDIYLPWMSPFLHDPIDSMVLPPHYGYRFTL